MSRNPYPGLRSFEPGESELFFGREDETDELRRRLRLTHLLAVVGTSGSGKSSLVRCGLIPSLHAGFMADAGTRWRVAIMRPGEDPIGHLAAALDDPAVLGPAASHADTRRTEIEAGLRDSSLGLAETLRHAALPEGDHVLLVVDQFEELFRYRRSRRGPAAGDDAAAFVRLLIEGARRRALYVVLTLRSEFIGECMAFAGLPEAINAGQYLIPRMERDALRRAITAPALVRGATVAPRLAVHLLNELGDDLDRLPVLQHALMRAWDAWERDHREGEPLDLRHVGKVREAMSVHAEEAWAELTTPRAQALAERAWKALTVTTEQGLGLRRPTAFATLCAVCEAPADELAAVLAVFRAPGRAFLQPPADAALADDTVIDLTHESLMRLWVRLAGWVREEARSTEIYRRLLAGARQHRAGEASLWRPPELTLARRWQREHRPSAAWAGDAEDFALATGFLRRSWQGHVARRVAVAAALLAAVALLAAGLARDARRNAELAAARLREIDALNLKVQELTQARREAGVARAQDLARVEALRAANATLKARVAALDADSRRIETEVATLRESSRTLETTLDRVRLETDAIEQRGKLVAQGNEQLDAEIDRLQDGFAQLAGLPATLDVQRRALAGRLAALQQRHGVLHARFVETQPCGYVEAMAPQAFVLPGAAKGPPEPAPGRAQLGPIPPDPGQAEALRRRIEALARELAALLDERARMQDEIAFLEKANGLLDAQRGLLEQEVSRLAGLRAALNARRQALQAAVATAEADRDRQQQYLTQLERERTGLLAQAEAARARHRAVQSETAEKGREIGRLEDAAVRQGAANQRLVDHLAPIVEALARHAAEPGARPDLAAMLAVKAYRWTPHEADDPAQPAVYNGLWLALRDVDPKLAAELIAPARTSAGKLGTTSSARMVQALCERAGRPFTEAEWRTHMKDACFTPQSARACPP